MGERARRDREHFDSIARQYSRKDLHRAARVARRHRLERTLAPLGVRSDVRVLEIGCGAGFAAEYLKGRYGEYRGIDHSHELIEHARAAHGGPGIEFEVADALEYDPDMTFDVVFMIGLLHHLEDVTSVLAHLRGLLEPGGWLVANEPQPGNPAISLARAVRKRLDRAYSSDQVELSSAELRAALESAGLTDVRVIPQGLLSTPFAEVPLQPEVVTERLARGACAADRVLERLPSWLLRHACWNFVAAGRREG